MNVLLTIDDSHYADAIIDFALAARWGEDVQFAVLNVVEPLLVGSYMSLFPSAFLEDVREKARAYGKLLVAKVAEQVRQAFPSSTVTEHVVEGFPKEEIVDFAKSWPADVILVGSHGRRGAKRFVLGSVSQAVCLMAPCSVLIVKLRQDMRMPSVSG